jgi:hypothetical protein
MRVRGKLSIINYQLFSMRLFGSILFFVLFTASGVAQEYLTGMQENPVVKARMGELHRLKAASAETDTIPVGLPFFDDFSEDYIFPSADRWIDQDGFVNDDYPVFPVNIGALTMDAINDSGHMYSNAVPGPVNFIADHLTSRYIRLDSAFSPVPRKLTIADSVYLSFYYQPQGRAFRGPSATDSLILQFLARPAYDTLIPGDTVVTHMPDKWNMVWYANGTQLDTFYLRNNKYFMQVMVPVTDAATYFKKKFRFRFLNYVSLASSAEPSWQSNCDQWNLDNVFLNTGRNLNDTVYPELRFIERVPSLLESYQSMPYPQYCDDPTNAIRDTIDMLMSNRDVVSHLSTYGYTLTDESGSFNKVYDGGNYSIEPIYTGGYVTWQPFAHPAMPYIFPISSADSAVFKTTHIVRDNAPGSAFGDTITGYQRFYNYFAYDDGTPEAGYGLTPAGSKLACKFRLNKSPDTLRAIRFYFNRTLGMNNQQWFYLCVWNDNAGNPGDTIWSALVMPRFTDSLNKFVTYHVPGGLRITGTFYVGWIQTTNDNLNVGFDRYNNNQMQIYYNSIGQWTTSSYTGSLMIRPVVGKPIPLGVQEPSARNATMVVYPNPCNTGTLHIQIPGQQEASMTSSTLTISNIFGQRILRQHFSSSLDVSSLPNGLYFLELSGEDGFRRGVTRFIISR